MMLVLCQVVPRMGRWIDFEGGYKTMDTTYMESVWWVCIENHDDSSRENVTILRWKMMILGIENEDSSVETDDLISLQVGF